MPDNQSHGGDPDGRLLSRRDAAIYSEAGHLAHAVEIALKRVSRPESHDAEIAAKNLAELLSRLERDAEVRSTGHQEARKRYRRPKKKDAASNGFVPLNRMSIDECGQAGGMGAGEHWFSLGGIVMTTDQEEVYSARANAIKKKFLHRTSVTFHEPLMRNHKGEFWFRGDRAKQADFTAAIDDLILDSEFTAFAVGIRKLALIDEVKQGSIDPYLPLDAYSLAIHLMLERFIDYLATQSHRSRAVITLEAQGPRENAEHQRAIADTLTYGTQWVSERAFYRHIRPGAMFVPKQGSHPVELADMLARDVFEWIRSDCKVEPRRWDIWSDKFYQREDLRRGKFGLKVFPDSDIRDLIEQHRDGLR